MKRDGRIQEDDVERASRLRSVFRRLCRDDRRTYADMMSILMDAYEQKS